MAAAAQGPSAHVERPSSKGDDGDSGGNNEGDFEACPVCGTTFKVSLLPEHASRCAEIRFGEKRRREEEEVVVEAIDLTSPSPVKAHSSHADVAAGAWQRERVAYAEEIEAVAAAIVLPGDAGETGDESVMPALRAVLQVLTRMTTLAPPFSYRS